MPKSRRNRVVALTNTSKHGSERKSKLIEEIRGALDHYAHMYVFSVRNMRTAKLKELRNKWKSSRFFFGKTKVMQIALGRTPDEESRENLHLVSPHINGNGCGLLLTNEAPDAVAEFFAGFSERDFARAGNVAGETREVEAGPLTRMAHSMEPYLRQLGMPTQLKHGVVHLLQDYTLCTAGEALTPEQAKLLKLFDIQMAEFRVSLRCRWSTPDKFERLPGADDADNLAATASTAADDDDDDADDAADLTGDDDDAGDDDDDDGDE